MKREEDLIMALANLDKIESCAKDKDSVLMNMVHKIRETLAQQSDINPTELARLTKNMENYVAKD